MMDWFIDALQTEATQIRDLNPCEDEYFAGLNQEPFPADQHFNDHNCGPAYAQGWQDGSDQQGDIAHGFEGDPNGHDSGASDDSGE